MKKKYSLLIAISLPILFMFLAPSVASAREFDTTRDFETLRQERETKRLEREQMLMDKKAEREAKLMERKEEREANRAELNQFKCDRINQALQSRQTKLQENRNRADNFSTKFDDIISLLTDKGYGDLPELQQLQTDVDTLKAMFENYKVAHDEFVLSMSNSSTVACDNSTTAEEARELAQSKKADLLAQRDELSALKDEIKEFYRAVIRPDIEALREAISALKTDDLSTNETESEAQ